MWSGYKYTVYSTTVTLSLIPVTLQGFPQPQNILLKAFPSSNSCKASVQAGFVSTVYRRQKQALEAGGSTGVM